MATVTCNPCKVKVSYSYKESAHFTEGQCTKGKCLWLLLNASELIPEWNTQN